MPFSYVRYVTNRFWFKLAKCEFEHTVPTYLSLFRIVAAPLIILTEILWMQVMYVEWVLVTVYVYSCLTDWFDGKLARLIPSWESEFGRYIDQFADKFFVISMIIWVFVTGRIGYDGWVEIELAFVIIIIIRDVVVIVARTFITLPANGPAKWKTTFQMIALGFIYGRGLFDTFFGLPLHESGTLFLLLATGFSIWSFVIYAKDATPILWPKIKIETNKRFPFNIF